MPPPPDSRLLALGLAAGRDTFVRGEEIAARLSLRNGTPRPLAVVPLESDDEAVTFSLSSEYPPVDLRASPSSASDLDGHHRDRRPTGRRVPLEPGAELAFSFNVLALFGELAPGDYVLSAWYDATEPGPYDSGPIPFRVVAASPVLARSVWEHGRVTPSGIRTAWVHADPDARHRVFLRDGSADCPVNQRGCCAVATLDEAPLDAWPTIGHDSSQERHWVVWLARAERGEREPRTFAVPVAAGRAAGPPVRIASPAAGARWLPPAVAHEDGTLAVVFHAPRRGLIVARVAWDGGALGVLEIAHGTPEPACEAVLLDPSGRLTVAVAAHDAHEVWIASIDLGPATAYARDMARETGGAGAGAGHVGAGPAPRAGSAPESSRLELPRDRVPTDLDLVLADPGGLPSHRLLYVQTAPRDAAARDWREGALHDLDAPSGTAPLAIDAFEAPAPAHPHRRRGSPAHVPHVARALTPERRVAYLFPAPDGFGWLYKPASGSSLEPAVELEPGYPPAMGPQRPILGSAPHLIAAAAGAPHAGVYACSIEDGDHLAIRQLEGGP